MAISKLYGIQETAELLGVTKRTVYGYVDEGIIKAVKIGREWRITEEDLKAFIAKGTKQARKEAGNK